MVGAAIAQRPAPLLRLKRLLRDVHPAAWQRVRLTDGLSIADLRRVIQLLMGECPENAVYAALAERSFWLACG